MRRDFFINGFIIIFAPKTNAHQHEITQIYTIPHK